jgi:hypothetical protein
VAAPRERARPAAGERLAEAGLLAAFLVLAAAGAAAVFGPELRAALSGGAAPGRPADRSGTPAPSPPPGAPPGR